MSLPAPEAFLQIARGWAERGWVRALDVALAEQLHALTPAPCSDCLLASVLVSHQAGQGHLLLDLTAARRHPRALIAVDPDTEQADWPTPEALISEITEPWAERLAGWSAVTHGAGATPLVLTDNALYLRRYYRHETVVAEAVDRRLADEPLLGADVLRPIIDRLFPAAGNPAEAAANATQKIACALAARGRFAVITGGPGTGKTNTVIRLLGLLQASALDAGEPTLTIRLAAPTGKAAARLDESIGGQVDQLRALDLPGGEALHEAIPREVTTLHRLLGARPGTRHFRHHATHPLPLDMVVVDEASMVDIEMMTALLEALPAHARLVLLGDRDQLASVEAGAVLGRLCARAETGHYHPTTAQWLEAATGETVDSTLIDDGGRPLDQAIAMLRHSFRFDAQGGIGQLARAINAGHADDALTILKAGHHDDLDYRGLRGANDSAVAQLITGQPDYPARPCLDADRAEWDEYASMILDSESGFQLLTPLRRGPFGADALNQQIEQALTRGGRLAPGAAPGRWYAGRPVMVTGNDYGLGLMNGDIGITLRAPARFGDSTQGDDLRVAFRSQGRIRWVRPSRLQRVETVYAMTVHKSQGSEFTHTALVVPDTAAPVLTRELIYTAVTRARARFTLLCASDTVLSQAIRRRVTRQSQLFS